MVDDDVKNKDRDLIGKIVTIPQMLLEPGAQ
jgi:hypothetical protein